MDDGQVGYITKLTPKKTLVWGKRKKNPLVAHINKQHCQEIKKEKLTRTRLGSFSRSRASNFIYLFIYFGKHNNRRDLTRTSAHQRTIHWMPVIYSVVDEPQTGLTFGFTSVTNCVGNSSHTQVGTQVGNYQLSRWFTHGKGLFLLPT